MRSRAFVRAERPRTVAGGNSHGVARRNESAAGQTSNHVRAGYGTPGRFLADVFHITDRCAQVMAQAGNRFEHIDDETEDKQDSDAL